MDQKKQEKEKEQHKTAEQVSDEDYKVAPTSADKSGSIKNASKTEKPGITTAEFGEPATKQKGKPFGVDTAPRQQNAKDSSQDVQDQVMAASKERSEDEDKTSGTT